MTEMQIGMDDFYVCTLITNKSKVVYINLLKHTFRLDSTIV